MSKRERQRAEREQTLADLTAILPWKWRKQYDTWYAKNGDLHIDVTGHVHDEMLPWIASLWWKEPYIEIGSGDGATDPAAALRSCLTAARSWLRATLEAIGDE